ncbi:unnamed protein product [Paramecium sonneborni]|uniref:Uncharacterized protein n=1 Tax=Paramecium sonneborni TaxID=65129 RepID=A0A8S1R1V6_9CILI|nr:unnamed protein product [Paramecium sonneborni]
MHEDSHRKTIWNSSTQPFQPLIVTDKKKIGSQVRFELPRQQYSEKIPQIGPKAPDGKKYLCPKPENEIRITSWNMHYIDVLCTERMFQNLIKHNNSLRGKKNIRNGAKPLGYRWIVKERNNKLLAMLAPKKMIFKIWRTKIR